ncbi:hypothetical protein HRbin34_00023 [bacterium HR34]|nr:hypothetical protein HRbin34_00023 [bacterium HR34]
MLKENNKKGFSLLETMIAVAIIGIAIGGPYLVINRALSNFLDAENRFKAVFLAQEGMELVRNIRDNNFIKIVVGSENLNPWDDGLTPGSCYEIDYNDSSLTPCSVGSLRNLKINSNGFYDYDDSSGTDTMFKRYIIISDCGSDCLEIRSIVKWNFKGEENKYELVGRLYNWIQHYVP